MRPRSWFWVLLALVGFLLGVLLVGNVEAQCPGGVCPGNVYQPPAMQDQAPLVPVQRPGSAPPYVCRINNSFGGMACLGSGTLIYRDDRCGVVATCAHIFREGKGALTVTFPGRDPVPAEPIATDGSNDIALLRTGPIDVQPATVAPDNEFPKQGEPAVGAGFGPNGTYREIRGRVLGYQAKPCGKNWNLAISGGAREGDSGGPIFDSRGRLVAVLWGTDGSRTVSTSTVALGVLCERNAYLLPWNAQLAGERLRCGEGGCAPPPMPAAPAFNGPFVDAEARAMASEALSIAKQLQGGEEGLIEKAQQGVLGRLKDHVQEAVWGLAQKYGIWGLGGLGVAGWLILKLVKKDVRDYIASGGEDKLFIQRLAGKTPWEWDDRIGDKIAERMGRRWGSEQGPVRKSAAMAKEDLGALVGLLRDLPGRVAAAVKGQQHGGTE